MDSIAKRHPNNPLSWKYKVFENMDHWSCVIPSVNYGLVEVCRNYFTDQKVLEGFAQNKEQTIREQIEAFNKRQLEIYGYVHEPTHKYLRFVANDFRIQEKYEAAKELYLLAIENGNDYVVTHFNLAETYEALQENKLAKAAYQQTLEKLEEQKPDLKIKFYDAFKEEIENRLEQFD